jgi:hypothetical protein
MKLNTDHLLYYYIVVLDGLFSISILHTQRDGYPQTFIIRLIDGKKQEITQS